MTPPSEKAMEKAKEIVDKFILNQSDFTVLKRKIAKAIDESTEESVREKEKLMSEGCLQIIEIECNKAKAEQREADARVAEDHPCLNQEATKEIARRIREGA